MNDHKEPSAEEILNKAELTKNDFKNDAIYKTIIDNINNLIKISKVELTAKTKALQEENERLKEKLVDREKMHEIDKKKLLFKDAVELPCKDAEYELLQQSNAKLIEALEKSTEIFRYNIEIRLERDPDQLEMLALNSELLKEHKK